MSTINERDSWGLHQVVKLNSLGHKDYDFVGTFSTLEAAVEVANKLPRSGDPSEVVEKIVSSGTEMYDSSSDEWNEAEQLLHTFKIFSKEDYLRWGGRHFEFRVLETGLFFVARILDSLDAVRDCQNISSPERIIKLREARDMLDICWKMTNVSDEIDLIDKLDARFSDMLSEIYISPSDESDWWFVHTHCHG